LSKMITALFSMAAMGTAIPVTTTSG
jgi:hypothetical protein